MNILARSVGWRTRLRNLCATSQLTRTDPHRVGYFCATRIGCAFRGRGLRKSKHGPEHGGAAYDHKKNTMELVFVHISDIHFGQEKGGQTVVDDDVKEQIIEDCRRIFEKIPADTIRGVIATGDVAYSGKEDEYKLAGIWFDKLTTTIGCLRSNVFIVPGNHDIDRNRITENCSEMLQAIAEEGDVKLDKYLEAENDREQLFSRFDDYRLFAQAYDCAIDDEGGLAGDHPLEISEGRVLRFVGLNSALICGANDKKGRLLLGQRQRVVQRNKDGEELVVLMHHPLDWLLDSEDASDYLRSRARVVISGHEHMASSKLVPGHDGRQVLMISAGATVPPAHERKRYCFNIITFRWDTEKDNLTVGVNPREWDKKATQFAEGTEEIGGIANEYSLVCPNFQKTKKRVDDEIAGQGGQEFEESAMQSSSITNDDEEYALLVLSFFRDIEESERLKLLVELDIIPKTFKGTLTHSIERRFLDKAKQAGKIGEIKKALRAFTPNINQENK